MKRTIKPDLKSKCKWKNLSGTFRLSDGRIIKPNEIFYTDTKDEVPLAFLDSIKLLEGEEIFEPVKTNTYSLVENEVGLFDVVDKNGKVVTENPLSEEEAQELLESLR